MAEVYYPHPDHGSPAGRVTEREYGEGIGWASPSGLFGTPSDPSPLFLSGGSLWLRAGVAARLCGVAYRNDGSDLQITGIPNNGGSSVRRDHVVLRLTWSTMRVQRAVIQGVAGAALPAVSQQRGTGFFDVSLGELAVPAGGGVSTATVTRRAWYLGTDGQVLCTDTTRPPHDRGRRIFETNTGRAFISTGTQWLLESDDATSSLSLATANWTAPSFNTIRRRNGWVMWNVVPRRVSGNFGSGTTTTLGTIPAGFRPVTDIESVGYAPSSGAVVSLRLDAGGQATMTFFGAGIQTDRYVNLPTVTYPVAY